MTHKAWRAPCLPPALASKVKSRRLKGPHPQSPLSSSSLAWTPTPHSHPGSRSLNIRLPHFPDTRDTKTLWVLFVQNSRSATALEPES